MYVCMCVCMSSKTLRPHKISIALKQLRYMNSNDSSLQLISYL